MIMLKRHTRLLILNLNGPHNPIKRRKVIAKMKGEKQDILFWQEMHLSDAEQEKLKKMGFTLSYYSFKKGV